MSAKELSVFESGEWYAAPPPNAPTTLEEALKRPVFELRWPDRTVEIFADGRVEGAFLDGCTIVNRIPTVLRLATGHAQQEMAGADEDGVPVSGEPRG